MPDLSAIAHIFKDFQPILANDDSIEPYLSDVVLTLRPLAVLRPASQSELVSILRLCQHHAIPYTASASRTSVTGASVTDQGVLISVEKLVGIGPIEEHPLGASLTVEIGTPLRELQEHAQRHGYAYPPDPTSWEDVLIGGTIATNATGENSYHYGSTRNYILELKVFNAKGEIQTLQRNRDPLTLFRGKNRAGLFLEGEEIDWHIGAEGSLGFLLEARLLLIPKPASMLSAMLFFPGEDAALDAAIALDQKRDALKLRCLEYMDQTATGFMREKSQRFQVPSDCVTLYVKSELIEENGAEAFLEALHQLPGHDPDTAIAAMDHLELLEFRRLRHHVPATINEISFAHRKEGGGKVSSDWWVPLKHLKSQFDFMRQTLHPFSDITATFGHIGNGHPHVNIMASNAQEKREAIEATRKCMQNAARLGGGVAGEHGLGKIKTWALELQWDQEQQQKMRAIKSRLDPQSLAAPGNLFGENS